MKSCNPLCLNSHRLKITAMTLLCSKLPSTLQLGRLGQVYYSADQGHAFRSGTLFQRAEISTYPRQILSGGIIGARTARTCLTDCDLQPAHVLAERKRHFLFLSRYLLPSFLPSFPSECVGVKQSEIDRNQLSWQTPLHQSAADGN